MAMTIPRIRSRFRAFYSRFAQRDLLLILSLLVGTACGLAAVLLDWLIHLIRSVATSFFEGSGNWYLLVLPGMGMLLAMLAVRYIIKDDIGHGVTKVLQSISKNESRIRSHNIWSSPLASSVTIGLGGSVGAEAPIVYTGAAIGSNVARWMDLSQKDVTILLGCGAAGAIAGIFKAPLAGVLFTLEILLFNISMSSMLPLLLSTVAATVVSYIFTGVTPQFSCDVTPFAMRNIPAYVVLGIFCSLCSLYFNKMTMFLEDYARKLRSPYVKWLICAVLLGLLIFLFPPLYGEGYECLQTFLDGGVPDLQGRTPIAFMLRSPLLVPVFFLLIIILKVFSMTFTNAGGGVGGTFGPTLFVGGIAGFVVSRVINLIFINSPFCVPEANFVLVGMAGLMAGVMQAPMTAVFLIAEISGGYELLLPLIITASISYGIAHSVDPYSIYTKRIAKRGELLTHDSDQAVLTLLKVEDFVESDLAEVRIDDTLGMFAGTVAASHRDLFPVLDERRRFQGYVRLEDVRKDMFNTELYDTRHVFNYMRSAPVYVYEDDSMQEVMNKFETSEAWNLPVVTRDRTYLGFVSKSKIFSAYRARIKDVSHD